MKKRILFVMLALILTATLLAACGQDTATPTTTATTSSATTAQPETIELKLSHIMSPSSVPQYLYQYFADQIYERTQGRVKITVYSSGILNPPPEGLDAVRTGVADIVHHSPNFSIGMQPTAECLALPVPARSSWVINKAAADLAEHFNVAGLKEFSDVHFMSFVGPAGPYYPMTKDDPIYKISDVDGLQMRCGGVHADMITAWGGTPVGMSTADVYESLSKGVIGGGMLSGEHLTAWKLDEQINHITIIPTYTYGPSVLLMNQAKWNSLPADIQQIFNETLADLVDWDGKSWWYSDALGLGDYAAMQGKEIYTIPASEEAAWEDSVEPIIQKYIDTYADLGLPTADYVDYLKERCDYWNEHQPDQQESIAWVESNILK